MSRAQKGLNNGAENSHLPLRKREAVMQRFRSAGALQRFIESFPPCAISSFRLAVVAPPPIPGGIDVQPSGYGEPRLASLEVEAISLTAVLNVKVTSPEKVHG